MLHILSITAPVFLLIALGYLAVRTSFFPRADLRVLGFFVINIALPALLFKALSTRSFGEIINPGFLLAYGAGSLITFGVVVLLARRLRGRTLQQSAIIGMGAAMSNSAFIGLPVALQVLGPTASVVVALTLLVENLLMMPLVFALADGSAGGQGVASVVRATFARLAKNPLIIAIVFGFAASLAGLSLPQPIFRAVDMLAMTSAAVALFVIGGNLAGASVKGTRGDIALITIGKLGLHPLVVAAAVLLVPGIDPTLQAAAILFASLPMLSIYGIIGQRYGQEQMASGALVVATLASFLTISAVIGALTALGMLVPLR